MLLLPGKLDGLTGQTDDCPTHSHALSMLSPIRRARDFFLLVPFWKRKREKRKKKPLLSSGAHPPPLAVVACLLLGELKTPWVAGATQHRSLGKKCSQPGRRRRHKAFFLGVATMTLGLDPNLEHKTQAEPSMMPSRLKGACFLLPCS